MANVFVHWKAPWFEITDDLPGFSEGLSAAAAARLAAARDDHEAQPHSEVTTFIRFTVRQR